MIIYKYIIIRNLYIANKNQIEIIIFFNINNNNCTITNNNSNNNFFQND